MTDDTESKAAPATPPTSSGAGEDAPSAGSAAEQAKAEAAGGEPDMSKPHPLEHGWTLWFDNPNGRQKQTMWGQTLRSVYTFRTIEDFWCLYNNIVQPSRLVHGADFHVFKDGIEPKWEDPNCASGGEWRAPVPKGDKKALDTYWLHTVLAMIGEQFTEGHEVCGAVVSVRKNQDRVALWTRTASNEAVQISIGNSLKQILDMPSSNRLEFTAFTDAKNFDRKARARYSA